jgi:putative CocE/NonD family hydrolase
LPIILIRNPYTARGKKPDFLSALIAERGYQVVVQNCRGTWGSGGVFRPFRDDREDGAATLKWLQQQPWFSGAVGMFGLSYWGYVQLALAPGAPEFLKALVPQMSASRVYGVFRRNGILNLEVALFWNYSTFVANATESARAKRRATARRAKALRKGFSVLPVGDADKAALGFTSPFFQDVLSSENPEDEFWAVMDHSKLVKDIGVPIHFMSGWFDFFLPDQLADYQSLRSAGKEPYLTIGPWTHFSIRSLREGLKESLRWYDAYLRGNRSALRSSPVHVYVTGSDTWVNLPSWPPASTETAWYLRTGGLLSTDPSGSDAEPSRYRYDPADPTPSVGGMLAVKGGRKDNRALEARADVLTFTSGKVARPVTMMGQATVNLYVHSTLEHTDFFTRLCDVSRTGKSINLCDGMIRLTPEAEGASVEGVRRITIRLCPTAHSFKVGHRVRLQVSSGAHPMYTRNLGTGGRLQTETIVRKADQVVFHDRSHISSILLPLVPASR